MTAANLGCRETIGFQRSWFKQFESNNLFNLKTGREFPGRFFLYDVVLKFYLIHFVFFI